ncbi:hypothetical protein SAMN05216228_1021143 [Rhizobium tibeticum]|uniref:Uncharacterized protein n=1 Tax=Rhizobium tibeticum TaxID=501024 RepID=A0A1H8RKG2_9HYPH|nr:hypothetical protein RTCCBAU85039_4142 [Rhizobium tibeticum]SEO66668.1 hypothetical protein SAMN05216228_1021143 [Rhizobium tibeticum]
MKRDDCKESDSDSQSDAPDLAVGLLKHTGSHTSFRAKAMPPDEGNIGTGPRRLDLEKMSAAIAKQPTSHLEP